MSSSDLKVAASYFAKIPTETFNSICIFLQRKDFETLALAMEMVQVVKFSSVVARLSDFYRSEYKSSAKGPICLTYDASDVNIDKKIVFWRKGVFVNIVQNFY